MTDGSDVEYRLSLGYEENSKIDIQKITNFDEQFAPVSDEQKYDEISEHNFNQDNNTDSYTFNKLHNISTSDTTDPKNDNTNKNKENNKDINSDNHNTNDKENNKDINSDNHNINKNNENKKHKKYSEYNQFKKMKTNFTNFCINLVNKRSGKKNKIKKIKYKFIIKGSRKYTLKLLNSKIGDYLSNEISSKYTKNRGSNKTKINILKKKYPELKDFLEQKFNDGLKKYINGYYDSMYENSADNKYLFSQLKIDEKEKEIWKRLINGDLYKHFSNKKGRKTRDKED